MHLYSLNILSVFHGDCSGHNKGRCLKILLPQQIESVASQGDSLQKIRIYLLRVSNVANLKIKLQGNDDKDTL